MLADVGSSVSVSPGRMNGAAGKPRSSFASLCCRRTVAKSSTAVPAACLNFPSGMETDGRRSSGDVPSAFRSSARIQFRGKEADFGVEPGALFMDGPWNKK
ncbi:hypothetical protein ACFVW1_01915 [Streptomyces olivochromogenes]|uniref:hypothetical protein n=1 Tax=Streptomyces olivochromogenes TaxID=1963 RepID=UPI0036DDA728